MCGDIGEWRAHCYAEGVYFHDFVQGFLFSPRETRKPDRDTGLDRVPFRLFRRSDITAVTVTLGHWGKTDVTPRSLRLTVERVNLYLFRTGAAIVVIETVYDRRDHDQKVYLSDVQNFHEQFRRAYIPFAQIQPDPDSAGPPSLEPPGLVVREVVWHTADGGPPPFLINKQTVADLIDLYLTNPERDRETDLRRRTPPLFEHWKWLLADALPLARPAGQLPLGDAQELLLHILAIKLSVHKALRHSMWITYSWASP